MARCRVRTFCAGGLVAAAVLISAGCSNGGSPSSTASRASKAIASATASAKAELNEIKHGVNAKADVKAGAVSIGQDGHAVAPITVTNKQDHKASYAVEVNFRDADGNLLDVAVVTVSSVQPRSSKKATARSHRELSGHLKAQVGAAVRY
ncbi:MULTISPECIES: FxLYD domain-containing protein [Streptomyces]|uniref:FxLYD domain-containing protein n=1 Tax=Streptomyces lonegramiae TaxID=3075524 RepID=A0ABU2XKB9_9ACTN|nr:FxLYD domain-containing protein [Streptomyces sp. DSM 41529]MDT0546331.1 FxLYD domain-containing protein [Streptomyces sp. DSM 41529]